MPTYFERMYKALERNKQRNKELKLKREQKRLAKYREHLMDQRIIANYNYIKSNESRIKSWKC